MRIQILGARTDRYLRAVCDLQEMVSQLREAYQSQLSIRQNDLMKVFTVVTAISGTQTASNILVQIHGNVILESLYNCNPITRLLFSTIR